MTSLPHVKNVLHQFVVLVARKLWAFVDWVSVLTELAVFGARKGATDAGRESTPGCQLGVYFPGFKIVFAVLSSGMLLVHSSS
jgi:hypothetical protein